MKPKGKPTGCQMRKKDPAIGLEVEVQLTLFQGDKSCGGNAVRIPLTALEETKALNNLLEGFYHGTVDPFTKAFTIEQPQTD